MAEYRLSPAAENDLERIWMFTCDEWGLDQADLYIDMLAAAFMTLADAPQLAPACDDVRSGYRRRIAGRHVIYFRITDYGIAIIRVLHERMDVSRHL